MDEFYLEINSIFYLKWIVIQGKKYNLKINLKMIMRIRLL